MHFPQLIDSKRSKHERARLRLKHLLQVNGLHKFASPSIHNIASQIGVDHSSIFCAIRRGYFTEDMAAKLSELFGSERLPVNYLTDPLKIEASDQ